MWIIVYERLTIAQHFLADSFSFDVQWIQQPCYNCILFAQSHFLLTTSLQHNSLLSWWAICCVLAFTNRPQHFCKRACENWDQLLPWHRSDHAITPRQGWRATASRLGRTHTGSATTSMNHFGNEEFHPHQQSIKHKLDLPITSRKAP